MIFSLASSDHSIVVNPKAGLDIFCFFHQASAIECPEDLWFPAICTSLKLKREVVILEAGISEFPVWDAKRRWQASENWCWLSPRGLSTISEAYLQNPMNFQVFKAFLTSAK